MGIDPQHQAERGAGRQLAPDRCCTGTRLGAQPGPSVPVHVPWALAAAHGTRPRRVGGPRLCPCRDTAGIPLGRTDRQPQPSSRLFQHLFFNFPSVLAKVSLSFGLSEPTNNCSQTKRNQDSVPPLPPSLPAPKKSVKKSYKNGSLSHLARLRLYVIANWV